MVRLLAASVSVEDSDTAQQVLASVAAVAAATGELLTEEAKGELLQVAQTSGWPCCFWLVEI